MIQPPSQHVPCPRCGNCQTVLILTESNLPQLNSFGYPRYFCPTCQAAFSMGDQPSRSLPPCHRTQQTEGSSTDV